MEDKIKAQVRDVLRKYDKSFSGIGVDANLIMWVANKGGLVGLLRKHPNWDEDALAVMFDVSESREIEAAKVNECATRVSEIAHIREIANYTCFMAQFCCAVNGLDEKLSDARAGSLKNLGVACAGGQKTSRVINAICKQYGVDKFPEYNALFARLADSLNPIKICRKALLSVHPCDYLEMSGNANSWSSCHGLYDGSYRAGTLSYMNDAVSMVFYTVDDGSTGDYYKLPKRTRQVFAYGNGILLQSRLYPNTDDEKARDTYRGIVQRAISTCLGVPNRWRLSRSQASLDAAVLTGAGALQYPDYTFSKYQCNVSCQRYEYNANPIYVGYYAYCIDCGKLIEDAGELHCPDCLDNENSKMCASCGRSFDVDDLHEIGGEYYCEGCSFHCEMCEEQFAGDGTHAYDAYGSFIVVCDGCLEDNFLRCDKCGYYFASGATREVGCFDYCPDCLNELCSQCYCCGQYFENGHLRHIGGELCCEDCAKEIEEPKESA